MWRLFAAAFAAVGAISAAASAVQAQTAARVWSTTVNADVRYYGWSSSLGGSGAQLYMPIGVQLSGRPDPDWKLNFLVRGGSIWSRQSTATASSEIWTPTDTNFTPTATYLGWNGITPFVSVSFNLPTAKKASATNTTQSNNKTDPDVVATPAFGEGFNVGPTIGVNINISEAVVLGVGAGYTYRGPFDQAGLTTLSRFDPGDVYTINTSLAYRGDRLSVQTSLAYSFETKTFQDGAALYRAGDRIIAGLQAAYTWNDNWGTKFGLNYSHFEKNYVTAAGVSDLVREAFNSNSDVTKLSLEVPFSAANYTIGPNVGFLYRNRNGYDPTTYQFLAAKTSWNAGVAGSIAVSRQFMLNLSLQHIWVREGGSPTKIDAANVVVPDSAVPESFANAWVASLGGSMRF